ncbi:IS200/IS605 family transposase [Malonomonas rubra]|uniref:IS200/IS605 family transposase n=1 Tax=Malonomonas rubra TaxID=57040 RepID=UPI0034E97A3C
MSGSNTTYNSTRHAKFLICYHFIWCPKYRKGILDTPATVEVVKAALEDVATDLSCEIVALEVMPDHVHISLSAIPALSPAEIVARLKSKSGARVAAKFPKLMKRGRIWSRSYFCSTLGSASVDVVKRYIENQWSKIS